MTLEQAKAAVRQYTDHQWTYEVDDNGTIVIGGNDPRLALAHARANGHEGPYVVAAACQVEAAD